ncbi:MAG: hypothetical protein JW940_17605 [Polyangiaceae bacterium]|nr:hypothetical protein [Polyangiaceae bacterium]
MGYVLLRSGDTKAALEQLELARGLTSDAKLLAVIWYNSGLAYELQGDAERSRAAFAVSSSLGSKAAQQKLGERSRCPTAWKQERSPGEGSFAASYREVIEKRFYGATCTFRGAPIARPVAVPTEPGAARALACLDCVEEYSACDGSVLSDGRFMDYDYRISIVEVEGRKDLLFMLGIGYSGQKPQYEVRGKYFTVQRRPVTASLVRDGQGEFLTGSGVWVGDLSPDLEPLPGSCAPGDEPIGKDMWVSGGGPPLLGSPVVAFPSGRTLEVYSLTTRERVLFVQAWNEAVRMKVSERAVAISGAGCDAVVPFEG